MKNVKKSLALGLYKGKLVPVTPDDLKKIIQEFSENWGKLDTNYHSETNLRFFPLNFLEVLIETFNVTVIK